MFTMTSSETGTRAMRRKRTTLFITSLLAVSTGLMAGAPGALARQSEPATHRPVKKVTTTTVMGGGSPSTWPAAKPKPPSLAGAYSPNMKTAFLALVRYSDWVGTHPNPALVKRYTAQTSDIYRAQVYLMQQMRRRGWHLPPTPTQIDFLAVVDKPKRRLLQNGKVMVLAHHPAYTGGTVDAVIEQVTEPYLNAANRVVGHTAKGTGPEAWTIELQQDVATGQFVISGYYGVTVHGSLRQWEDQIGGRK
jgi:hypothetical protein